MKPVRILAGLLIFSGITYLFMVLSTDSTPASTAAIPDAPSVASPEQAVDSKVATLRPETAGAETRRASVATESSMDSMSASSATARVLQVNLTIPAGAPLDPELSVVAISADALGRDEPGELLHRLRTETDAGLRHVRANVDSNGAAELKLPADLAEPLILVDGRFLFVSEPSSITADVSQLDLETELGGVLAVRLVSNLDSKPTGELRLMGGGMGGGAGWQSRERDSDVEGQFEFRAVDSSLNWMLMPNLEDHYAPMN
ncbi:MAG: hypothetical protein ACI8TQ_004024, partial [Planctomycetota bacterium]